jgi:hypothetical protein
VNGNRIWVFVTALLAVGAVALSWFIGASPLLAQAAASDAERTGIEAINAAKLAELQQMKLQFADLDNLTEDLQALRSSIPGDVDTDYLTGLLSQYQAASGAVASLVAIGEAVQYGIPIAGEGETTAGPAPASGPQATGSLATALYTVPVTITFNGVGIANVMEFVRQMQTGSRLFLVTQVIARGDTSTITAYMFVIHDPASAAVLERILAEAAPEPTVVEEPTTDEEATDDSASEETPEP